MPRYTINGTAPLTNTFIYLVNQCQLATMVIRVVEFSSGGYKIGKILPKNQGTQRKLLNFDNLYNGDVSKSALF